MQPVTKQSGFTLLETIIYIGLFGIMFSGIFVSIYPIITGAARLTQNILVEGETAFILSKIRFALANTITSEGGEIATPTAGNTSDTLVLEYDGDERYRIEMDDTNTFCSAPLICKMLTMSIDGDDALPLNAQRVDIENFSVTHHAPLSDGTPRYLEISFTADDEPVGPVRYYLHF
jgi:type II secretory pathway pseudopilin PulG